MNSPVPHDVVLAQGLQRKQEEAMAEFAHQFGKLLARAWQELQADIPGCSSLQSDLLLHVCETVGRGYLVEKTATPLALAKYVGLLRLSDLFWAGACLAKDESACARLVETSESKILPSLLRQWRARARVDEISKVTAELPGHCLQELTKGNCAGKPRLATFLGRASLTSWLFVLAVRLLQENFRAKSAFATADYLDNVAVSSSALQPDNAILNKEADVRGGEFRVRLVLAIKDTLSAMPPRRRLAAILHWVHGDRPSEIATKMHVSRPRVTEILSEAKEQIRVVTENLCREIAVAADRNMSEVQELLLAELGQMLSDDP